MGFTPSKAEPDIWMQCDGDYYEYIAVYVDTISKLEVVLYVSIIRFYVRVYQALREWPQHLTMTTLASGGNAMASPPDPPPPSLTPGYGGDKGILSDCNPSRK